MQRSALVLVLFGFLAACGSGAPGLDLQRSSFDVDRATGVVADGQDAATATLHLVGDDGKPMAGVAVTLTVNGDATVAPSTLTTDAGGLAQAKVTSVHSGLDSLSAEAQVDGKSITAGTVTITFVAGAPDPSHSTLTVPASTHTDESVPVVIALADAHDNPCPGVTVTLSVSGAATVTPASGTTTADGSISATLTDSVVETVTVSAIADAAQLSAQVDVAAPAWKNVGPSGGDVRRFTLDPTDPAVGYAVTATAGVFKTVDGGADWFPIDSGLTLFNLFTDLVLDPAWPSRLFLVSDLGLFASTDAGASWSPMDSRLARAVAIDPTQTDVMYAADETSGLVYKSVDGGQSWTQSADVLGSPVNSLIVDPTSPSTVYAMTDLGAYTSTDAGAHWTYSSTGLGNTLFARLVLAPTTPATLFAYNTQGIWRSTDGANWTSIVTGGATVPIMVAVDPSTPETVYQVDSSGLSVSFNSGTDWSPVTTPGNVLSVAVAPKDSQRLFTGVTPSGIHVSDDAGATWYGASDGLRARLVTSVLIDPADPTRVLAASPGGDVNWSTDAGASWSMLGANVVYNPYALAKDAWNTSNYDVLTDGAVYTSSGGSWTKVGDALPFEAWDGMVSTSDTLFISAEGQGVLALTNGTTTWKPMNSGLTDLSVLALAGEPANENVLFAATGSGLFKTVNAGASWQKLSLPADHAVRFLAVGATDPAVVYAAEMEGEVYRSGDGGNTWTQVRASGKTPTALAVDPTNPEVVYLAHYEDGLLKSTDGGKTWAAKGSGLWLPDVRAIALDASAADVVYLGTGAGVFKSTTAGE